MISPTLSVTKTAPIMGICIENIIDISHIPTLTMAKSLVITPLRVHIVSLDLKIFSRHQQRTKSRVI
jgi:hypothetical protein